jgi:hypothetical protein
VSSTLITAKKKEAQKERKKERKKGRKERRKEGRKEMPVLCAVLNKKLFPKLLKAITSNRQGSVDIVEKLPIPTRTFIEIASIVCHLLCIISCCLLVFFQCMN